MRKSAVAMVVIVAMSGTPALAADLTGSIPAAVERELAQSRPAARGENPYKTTAIGLMAGGAGVTALGFIFPTGVECSVNDKASTLSAECGQKSNKALVFGGLAAVGLGAFLYVKGEGQRSQPQIVVQGGRILLRQRIRW